MVALRAARGQSPATPPRPALLPGSCVAAASPLSKGFIFDSSRSLSPSPRLNGAGSALERRSPRKGQDLTALTSGFNQAVFLMVCHSSPHRPPPRRPPLPTP